jgi:large subunit ribosomal protein L32
MPNPKRRHSKTRRDKRRTHDKATLPTLFKCQKTGQYHLMHHAHWHEGKLYYKGRVVIDKSPAEEQAIAS